MVEMETQHNLQDDVFSFLNVIQNSIMSRIQFPSQNFYTVFRILTGLVNVYFELTTRFCELLADGPQHAFHALSAIITFTPQFLHVGGLPENEGVKYLLEKLNLPQVGDIKFKQTVPSPEGLRNLYIACNHLLAFYNINRLDIINLRDLIHANILQFGQIIGVVAQSLAP